jgi:hypothetical protein
MLTQKSARPCTSTTSPTCTRERAQPTQLDGTVYARCISLSSDSHIRTALLRRALPHKQAPSNWPPACKEPLTWMGVGTSRCLCLGHHACTRRAAACVATHARIQAGMLLLTDCPTASPQGTFTRVRLMRVSLSGRSTPWRTAQEWSMASPPPFSTWGTPRLALVRRVNDVATCGSTRHPHPYSRVCACAPHAQIPAPSRHSPASLLARAAPRSNLLSHTNALTLTQYRRLLAGLPLAGLSERILPQRCWCTDRRCLAVSQGLACAQRLWCSQRCRARLVRSQ